MDFRRYYRSLTIKEKAKLAEFLGSSVQTVYAYGSGRAKPGFKRASQIVEFSGGEVTIEEVRPDLFNR